MNRSAPAIEARDVRVTAHGHTILDGVNLSLQRGETAVLLGPNGCGKTTLARVLMGYQPVRSGTLHVLDKTIGATNLHELRQHVRLVSSTTALGGQSGTLNGLETRMRPLAAVLTGIDGSLMLTRNLPSQDEDRAMHLLRVVGLGHRETSAIGTLSTGEQRRLLLARAMIRPPELLLLDEAAAGLDVAGREQMLLTLRLLMAAGDRPTVLMITHHVEEMPPDTDRVFLMNSGRILRSGTPAQVMTPELLTETFGCRVYVRKASGRYTLEVLPEAWLDLLPETDRIGL
ncbi:ABC transporter ATP-binding protein [Mucisphaera calidilacus]|uniref:Putative ABC transporter ATP-binding protein YlmA n=1 Tax=Mucisphaera calidilacus TaxID=2527982 RepID=A0A518BZH5_9BACT|nr:ATP-binding cassette domain-containing protein [Mucisphaera calidilacus]QDU72370.1 putative ABC transporter ATP-binding protein YlmA [Mucisphaera calidilacus]